MDDEVKSRTTVKKEMIELQKLGERLVQLPPERIAELGLPETLEEALLFAKTIKKHSPRHRQMQYIGVLMRDIDAVDVRETLDVFERGPRNQVRMHHRIEALRVDLLQGQSSKIDELCARYPEADRQRLSQLVRNAAKEAELEKSPKASRALFRYLREIIDSANV
ncbi:MAG: DUF615 domain-containing protein [Deltaproteobacteria bacterium]|nr:DUF615 domain-containing protein [Deltaproteobacteria bacterium]